MSPCVKNRLDWCKRAPKVQMSRRLVRLSIYMALAALYNEEIVPRFFAVKIDHTIIIVQGNHIPGIGGCHVQYADVLPQFKPEQVV